MGKEKTLADISLDGIKYASSLNLTSSHHLARKLYSYYAVPFPVNQRKVSWTHETVFPTSNEWLEIKQILASGWVPVFSETGNHYWISWKPVKTQTSLLNPGGASYKLYISPHPVDYYAVLTETIKILTYHNVYSFKTGSNYYGINRPDKIVAYFGNYDALQNAAKEIVKKITPFKAHGVPFTAPFDGTAIVSWGIDPPTNPLPGSQSRSSYRAWITRELAHGIIEGKKMLSDEPWEFALHQLKGKGMNIDTWEPTESMFAENRIF